MVGEASTNNKNVNDVQTNTGAAAAKANTTGDVSGTAPTVHKTRGSRGGKRGGRGDNKTDASAAANVTPVDNAQKAAKAGKKTVAAAGTTPATKNQAGDVLSDKDTRTPSRSTLRRQAKRERAARGDNVDSTGGINHPIVDQLNKKLDAGAKPTTKSNTTSTPSVTKASITIPKPRKVAADGGMMGPKDPILISAHYDAIIAQIDIQIAQGIVSAEQPSTTTVTTTKKQGQRTTTTNDAIPTMDALKAAKNLMIVEKSQALARWERIYAKLNPTTTTTTANDVVAASTAATPSDVVQQKNATRRFRGGRAKK